MRFERSRSARVGGADVLYIGMAVSELPACGGIQARSKGERNYETEEQSE